MFSYLALLTFSSVTMFSSPNPANGTDYSRNKPCSISNIAKCDNIHAIVSGKGFEKSLISFLGPQANEDVKLLYKGKLSYQLEEILNGPSDEYHVLADNRYFFTTCRTSECSEGGAIAFGAKGEIVAVAVITLHCAKRSEDCLDRPVLDLFIHDKDGESAARQAIIDWASQ